MLTFPGDRGFIALCMSMAVIGAVMFLLTVLGIVLFVTSEYAIFRIAIWATD